MSGILAEKIPEKTPEKTLKNVRPTTTKRKRITEKCTRVSPHQRLQQCIRRRLALVGTCPVLTMTNAKPRLWTVFEVRHGKVAVADHLGRGRTLGFAQLWLDDGMLRALDHAVSTGTEQVMWDGQRLQKTTSGLPTRHAGHNHVFTAVSTFLTQPVTNTYVKKTKKHVNKTRR